MDDSALDPLFTQCFASAKRMYFFMPLNPYSRFLNQMSRREYWTGVCVYYFVLFSQLLVTLLYFLYILDSMKDKDGDFLGSSASYALLILAINSYVITWNIFSFGPAVADFITNLYDTFPKTNKERVDLEVEKFTNDWSKKIKHLRNFFLLAVFGMTLSELLKSLAKYAFTVEWKPEMPISIWLPFDPKRMPIYPFAYAGECWLFLVNTCMMVAFEATMGGIIMLICLQFKKVQFEFRSIKFGSFNSDMKALNEAIKLHNRTLDLADKARTTFSVFLFINFLFSSMVISVFTFLLFTERDPVVKFKYCVNSFCFMGYVGMYGYFGDQLFDHVSIGYRVLWLEFSYCGIFNLF